MPIERPGYTRKTHPELYEQFGVPFMRKVVNPFVKAVAKHCDEMEGVAPCAYVELSGKSTRDDLIAFADFLDGVRLWVAMSDPDNPVLSRWDAPNAGAYRLDVEGLAADPDAVAEQTIAAHLAAMDLAGNADVIQPAQDQAGNQS